jgi:hypothetical protein
MKDYTRPVQVKISRWESYFISRKKSNRQGGTTDIRMLAAITPKGKPLQFKSGGFAVLTEVAKKELKETGGYYSFELYISLTFML